MPRLQLTSKGVLYGVAFAAERWRNARTRLLTAIEDGTMTMDHWTALANAEDELVKATRLLDEFADTLPDRNSK